MIRRLLRRRLYLRIYAAVLASLAAFALLAALAWQLWPRDEPRPGLRALSGHLVAELLPADAPAQTLAASLERWRGRTGADLALLDAQGRRVAAVGAELPSPPPDADADDARAGRRDWMRRRHGPPVLVVRLPDGRTLLASAPRGRALPWSGMGFALPVVLIALAVGVGAYPVARRLTRRLEALQDGVERLGQGDLAARADVSGDDEVARLAASFNRSAERIETLVNSHKALLANASHELRSPLARIRMGLELLGPGASAPIREELARSVAELDALVDEILLAARLDAAEPAAVDAANPAAGRGAWEEVDLAALAAEECARTGAAFELAGALAAESPGATMRGDPRLLRRLLRNLLENAVRHAGAAPAEARLDASGETLVLEVLDRGPGVAEHERERIFEPFYRAQGASERAGGVGLGLALVRQIARHHGGQAHCLPRDGGGSRFRVSLPRGPAAPVG